MRTLVIAALMVGFVSCQNNKTEYNDGDPHMRLLTLEGHWQDEVVERKSADGKRTLIIHTMTWIGDVPTMEQLDMIRKVVCKGSASFGKMFTQYTKVFIHYGRVRRDVEKFKKAKPGEEIPADLTKAYPYTALLFDPYSAKVSDTAVDLYVDGSLLPVGKKARDDSLSSQGLVVVSDDNWIEYVYYEEKNQYENIMGRILIPFKQ